MKAPGGVLFAAFAAAPIYAAGDSSEYHYSPAIRSERNLSSVRFSDARVTMKLTARVDRTASRQLYTYQSHNSRITRLYR